MGEILIRISGNLVICVYIYRERQGLYRELGSYEAKSTQEVTHVSSFKSYVHEESTTISKISDSLYHHPESDLRCFVGTNQV